MYKDKKVKHTNNDVTHSLFVFFAEKQLSHLIRFKGRKVWFYLRWSDTQQYILSISRSQKYAEKVQTSKFLR